MSKLKMFALAAMLPLLFVSCGRHYETVSGDALGTKIYTLDNGMKIFMSVNKETPRIQTYIAVKVGSKNDPPATTGLAHYFEHLMFKGTESFGTTDYAAEKPMLDEIENLFEVYRNTTDEDERAAIYHRIDSVSYEASKLAIPNEYDKLMSIIGAQGTNAWTSSDETVYTEDIPSNQIDNWARIQADRFRHGVIRGFHTELETIYEEKNMSLTSDSRKVWEALSQALYPNHPYGKQTTLGSQEHLKNPSITNVKKYHDEYYVPNNIAVCVSGDFDPDEMVAAIEKYFGDWEPNPSIPELQYEEETPITTPVVKDVYGLEREYLALGWRLPGAKDLKTTAVADIAGSILSNGKAGIMDVDVNQQQKAIYLGGGLSSMPDYSSFYIMGYPKEGQSLDELRSLALEQIAKLRNGDFDETLLSATVNNIKLMKMRQLERNASRAQSYVDAFINGIDWKDACHEIDRYAAVTKDDVIAFANEYLKDNNCAVIYKHIGEDKSVKKITAPKITPIVTNRDSQSDFLKEIQATQVKPIEPVYVDFSKDMSKSEYTHGVDLLYKQNKLNDAFTLSFIFNRGDLNDPALGYASDYLSYLGSEENSLEEFNTKLYDIACSASVSTGSTSTTIRISGLSENMAEAVRLMEERIATAKSDDAVLANCKNDWLKNRVENKRSQSSCFSALQLYMMLGSEYVKNTTLSNDAVMNLKAEDLLSKLRETMSLGHEILYYGPMSESEVKSALSCHKVSENAEALPEQFVPYQETDKSQVILAQYDAKQIYYLQYSNRGETYDPSKSTNLSLYNNYFGGGMNGIVFQEMREARGLAYSASARIYMPSYKDGTYSYMAFIATQNDKMHQAVEAFDEIIENMPVSQAAFDIAKESMISNLRTTRTNGADVLYSYRSCRRLGIDEPLTKQMFEEVQNLTLDDVVETQKEWVKDRSYTYAILGDIKDLDTHYLATLGQVKVLSLEDIFGY